MGSRKKISPEERAALLKAARKNSLHSKEDGTKIQVRVPSKARRRVAQKPGKEKRTIKQPPRFGGIEKSKNRSGRKKGKTVFRRTGIIILFLLLITGGMFSAKILNVGKDILNPDRSVIAQIADLFLRRGAALAGEQEGQVNVLLVGVGGEGHDGEDLADTIMVAMIRPEEKQVAFLSIPRDLFVEVPDSEIWQRINAVHAIGEKKNEQHGGPKLLQQKVEEILDISIHYYARADFAAFKHIIDEVGGVEVTIEKSFFDYLHEISFPAGTERMNGERALAYIRARYVEGPEGGDFKRAERQQHVLIAIRDKVFSPATAFDLRKASGILDALSGNVVTNFTLSELKRLADIIREIPRDSSHSAVLSTGPEGLLVGKPQILGGRPAATLQPRAGIDNYSEIQQFTKEIFDIPTMEPTVTSQLPTPDTQTPTPTPPSIAEEQPSVEVRNGTLIQGLAGRTATALRNEGFTVTSVGNASTRDRQDTVIIDLSDNEKQSSRNALIEIFDNARIVQFPENEAASTADFLVLLGADAEE